MHLQKLTGSHDETSRDLQKADSLIMSLILMPDVKQVRGSLQFSLRPDEDGGGGGEDSFVTVSSLGEANIARPNRGQIEFRSM